MLDVSLYGGSGIMRNKSLSIAMDGIEKESKYLPSCKDGHKVLFNFKGDNPKAGYCSECNQWFMVVEVSENTVKECYPEDYPGVQNAKNINS